MPGLAMHNFRGFERTSIFFSDVNFFVGENSTGKTSVLSVMEILSSPEFFYSGELSSAYCDLSAFEDNLTQNSSSKTFSLGYYRNAYLKSKYGSPNAVAFHFDNDNGLARIAKIAYIANGYLITGIFKKDRVVVQVNHAELISPKPIDALEKLMWGRPSSLKGEHVGNFTYFHKRLPTPSPIIAAMNVLAIEKIKKAEEDPNARIRINASLFPDLHWGAPIRAKPESVNARITRIYSPDGGHVPSIIRRAFGAQNDPQLEERITGYIKTFGKDSHLFDEVLVKEYGTDHSAPFEVRIGFDSGEHKLSNVGYGVSQALPVLVEVAAARNEENFVIQQPEVHLHPRAQAAFGDFFFDIAQKRGHTFYIETHSDFLIDRFRLQLNKSRSAKKPTTQIIFFKKNNSNGNTLHPIPIGSNGTFPEEMPSDYKDFFYKEEFGLLGIR